MGKREPTALKRGKRFHKLVQEEWLATAKDGRPRPERYIKRLGGKKGRIDILVEELGDFVSIVEIKATSWDRMKAKNVVRNVRRQIRQIWSYVEAEIEHYEMEVCPGVIFPELPRDPKRLALIESLFNEEGIQVVWHNESVEQSKKRLSS